MLMLTIDSRHGGHFGLQVAPQEGRTLAEQGQETVLQVAEEQRVIDVDEVGKEELSLSRGRVR